MYGFSVFLNQPIDEDYLTTMQEIGFTGIFTSVHIPEDDSQAYMERLTTLGDFAKRYQMEFIVDTSKSALEQIGLSFEEPNKILNLGLTGIRADYGIGNQTIADLSQTLTVALNASTISQTDIEELNEYQANFDQLEAWHNYYPRPETGLGGGDFRQQNQWLKSQGLTVMAFVPGDGHLRGPIYKGLPTIEDHRFESPFQAALELEQTYHVDKVYIGDPTISADTQAQVTSWLSDQPVIQLRARTSLPKEMRQAYHLDQVLTARMDPSRDLIRDTQSRMLNENVTIEPGNIQARPRGSVTIDNAKYQRYQGSIHISKQDLSRDEKVNVVGQVILTDRPLLDFIGPGTHYKIIWEAM